MILLGITAAELAKWKLRLEDGEWCVRPEDTLRLIAAIEAAQARIAELECSLGFSFQSEVKQLRQQLAEAEAELAQWRKNGDPLR